MAHADAARNLQIRDARECTVVKHYTVAPLRPATGSPHDTTRTDRALWPRAVMATLLFMILSLTVHLVDITWFDGVDQGAAVAEATLAHAGPAPH
jgi:hypothetical protein